ncbi:MAG TPA: MerR family transcriptional regulator [Kofleriaceae bacterium]|nr:MerR family transcriptional regulator [Kofleriaceae bacterium]
MDEPLTLSGLVAEVARRIAALPAPRNGQVRAVPDERTVRYYGTIGLLDRPAAMRGRTALYGRKHVAQVVAIKRLQGMGRSLSEIQQLWPTLADGTLARMSGVELPPAAKPPARASFWKRAPAGGGAHEPVATAAGQTAGRSPRVSADDDTNRAGDDSAAHAGTPHASQVVRNAAPAVELRLELAPSVVLSLSVDESVALNLSPADVHALRAAAAPLLAELASRRIAPHPEGDDK